MYCFKHCIHGHVLYIDLVLLAGCVLGDQCAKAVGVALGVLYQVLRSFHFRDKTVFLRLYKSYVRPHLEFSVPTWNPWLSKDVKKLEKVQEKFVKNVRGLREISYTAKCKELGLLTLENRRLYLDMVETFKLIHNHTKIDRAEMFELYGDIDRRHTRAADFPLNIVSKRSNLEIRRHFFSNRVTEYWNGLPNDLKTDRNLSKFKFNLKQHLMATHLEGNEDE